MLRDNSTQQVCILFVVDKSLQFLHDCVIIAAECNKQALTWPEMLLQSVVFSSSYVSRYSLVSVFCFRPVHEQLTE